MPVLRGYQGSFRLLYGTSRDVEGEEDEDEDEEGGGAGEPSRQVAELGVHAWRLTTTTPHQMVAVVTRGLDYDDAAAAPYQVPLLARPFAGPTEAVLEFSAHVDAGARWFRFANDWWDSEPWEGDLYLYDPAAWPAGVGDPTPLIQVRGYLRNVDVSDAVRGVVSLAVTLSLDRLVLRLDKVYEAGF